MHRGCPSVRPFVCLSVRLSPNFSPKLSSLKLWSLLTTYRASQRTHYWTPKIEDGGDQPSENHEIIISQNEKSSDFGYNSAADWPVWVKFVLGSNFSQNFGNGIHVMFVSLMQFGLRRAAPFVSYRYTFKRISPKIVVVVVVKRVRIKKHHNDFVVSKDIVSKRKRLR